MTATAFQPTLSGANLPLIPFRSLPFPSLTSFFLSFPPPLYSEVTMFRGRQTFLVQQ